MPRNFECPETGVLCVDPRCKKGIVCFEQEKQLAADSLSRVAEKELAIRRWVSREEFKLMEWSEGLQKRAGTWWGKRKAP
jgi:hypothetical protein